MSQLTQEQMSKMTPLELLTVGLGGERSPQRPSRIAGETTAATKAAARPLSPVDLMTGGLEGKELKDGRLHDPASK
ncbi:MAG: hypothetical protein QOF78_593 [Phycisphaerales bacterium]|jgi:hypothetical protein|nr:hypothetical protein [Phycisphaerales bacterium]